jgi:hypothetical protein
MTAPLLGLLALFILAIIVFAARANVKIRTAKGRGCGVKVYDLNADLALTSKMHTRSYQIALYLTMKSRSAEAQVSARAASR